MNVVQLYLNFDEHEIPLKGKIIMLAPDTLSVSGANIIIFPFNGKIIMLAPDTESVLKWHTFSYFSSCFWLEFLNVWLLFGQIRIGLKKFMLEGFPPLS